MSSNRHLQRRNSLLGQPSREPTLEQLASPRFICRTGSVEQTSESDLSMRHAHEINQVGAFRLGADLANRIPSHPNKREHIAHQSLARRNTHQSLTASNSRFVNRKTSVERRADASMRLGGFRMTSGISLDETFCGKLEERRKSSLSATPSEQSSRDSSNNGQSKIEATSSPQSGSNIDSKSHIIAENESVQSATDSESESDSSVSTNSSWSSSDDSETDSDRSPSRSCY